MKLTTNKKWGIVAILTAAGAFILPKVFGSNNNSNTNTGGGTTPTGGTTTTKPKMTAAEAYALALKAEYAANIIAKGPAYAKMQLILSQSISEGGEYVASQYANLMMLSSGSNVNVRLTPTTSGTSVALRQKDEGIGKTTGRFYKRNQILWAELVPNPAINRPVPYATPTKIYVALMYMKTVSPINNLSGITETNTAKGNTALIN